MSRDIKLMSWDCRWWEKNKNKIGNNRLAKQLLDWDECRLSHSGPLREVCGCLMIIEGSA